MTLIGLQGEYVLAGPNREPAIVIHDDITRLQVKFIGPGGELVWIDPTDFELIPSWTHSA